MYAIMKINRKELKEMGFISGVEVGHLIYQELGFGGADKKFYSIFKELRKLSSTIVIEGNGDKRGRKYYYMRDDVMENLELFHAHLYLN